MDFISITPFQKKLFILMVFIGAFVPLIFTHKPAFAARGNTAYICNTRVNKVGEQVVAGNRMYITYEFNLEGNDYARRFKDSAGNLQTENGSVIGSAGTCTHDGFWDGSNFDYNSPQWRAEFNKYTVASLGANFQSVANVYAGMGPNTNNPSPSNNYCGNTGIGINDVAIFGRYWRDWLGIDSSWNHLAPGSCADNSVYGSINDGGIVTLANRTLWCLGMGWNAYLGYPLNQWECQYGPASGNGLDAATVYTGGGDFAGFLNASNSNNRGRMSDLYAPRILNRQPINDLLPAGTNVPLSIVAQNTRDPIPPAWGPACANTTVTPVGVSGCTPPGLPPDPFINNKASTFMTFEVVAGPVIRGRIFNDVNNDGVYDAGDTIIQNGADCTSGGLARQTLAGVSVSISGISGQFNPDKCNPDPYYEAYLQAGTRTVSVNVPIGWEVVYPTSPGNYTINFGLNDNVDRWFGIRQIPVVCSNLFTATTTPSTVGTNEMFNVRINSSGVATAAGTGTFAIRQTDTPTGTPASGSNVINNSVTYSGAAPTGTSINNVTVSSPGNYFMRWTYNGGGISATCSQPLVVASKPYLQVFSGDISSGGYINSFNSGSGGSYVGSGGQLGVFSSTSVTEFVSASLRGSSPQVPKGLTLANTAGEYGGNFAASGAKTFTDYWNLSTGKTVQAADFHVPGNSGFSGKSYYFVNGDAYVDGNIVYAGSSTGWDMTNIPSFYLIANGNIYINSGADKLDGVYVAKNTIYTCTPGGNKASITPGGVAASCGNTLTVNGAFLAKNVKFLRLGNTLSQGTLGEKPAELSGAGTKAAETFITGPETWLVSPFSRSNSYNSITGLPPVL